MIELYGFQAEASQQISDRVVKYLHEPLSIRKGDKEKRVPFIQLLSAITASGKTIVLADAVSSIAEQLNIKPVVLWLSKATVVVDQTFAALDTGGTLHSLIDNFDVRLLNDYDPQEVRESNRPLLFFATVGTFNQKDREQGTRRIFRSAIDDALTSTWRALQLRPNSREQRRPLIVVYDEAHNLSDQQTDLLLELEPDAFLLATATQRVPQRFSDEIIDVLRKLGDRSVEDLITAVDAKAVADSGLIKDTVELVGRQSTMEEVVGEMVRELDRTSALARENNLPGMPKAVYVCKTNVVEGSDERDNHKRPFLQRQAPPILIWRYLTEKLKINPSTIAVYSDLKVDKSHPLPDEFVLYSSGDRDYESFVGGNYRHIIFNQSLQEGWDDPLVYFAYIDKSMGSPVQAEQIVGRLLRQPGRVSYRSERLNMAQIHVRVDSTGVFDEVVSSVQQRIKNENLKIKVIRVGLGAKPRAEYKPIERLTVPICAIVTDEAQHAIQTLMDTMSDYRRDDGTNTTGVGRVTRVQKVVGSSGNETFEWEEVGTSAMVLARWLFNKEVRRIYPNALGLAITSSPDATPTKFDARIGLGSSAASHIANVARKVAEAFIENTYLALRKPNPYVVGSLLQDKEELNRYENAAHAGYSGLNPDEVKFAEALDRTKLRWCRNPSKIGYPIPMIAPGKTENFYPDFLVWVKAKEIYAIDTKASFLHSDAVRKLVQIRPAGGDVSRLFVRFVTPGLVEADGVKKDPSGFTVWSFKPNGKPDLKHFESVGDAVKRCLKPDV